jgi:hypothetical protein
MTGGLTQVLVTFLQGLPNPALGGGTWTVVPFVTTKSVDIQRTGDTVMVGAPTITGQVYGLGIGQVNGQYTQQQISKYQFTLRLYATWEQDLVQATDWIALNSVTYFLNLSYSEGLVVLAKMMSYGQILNERGIWERELTIMIESQVGP